MKHKKTVLLLALAGLTSGAVNAGTLSYTVAGLGDSGDSSVTKATIVDTGSDDTEHFADIASNGPDNVFVDNRDKDADIDEDALANREKVYIPDDRIKDDNEVPQVPVPAAVWLFGSGLIGLVGVARRRALSNQSA